MAAKVYISGALVGSADLAGSRSKYEECAAILRASGFAPYLPHQGTDPEVMNHIPASEVFTRDLAELVNSEAVVAFLDEPSHGVGAELAICISHKIPILALIRKGSSVSRFIVGMLKTSNVAAVMSYLDVNELRQSMPDRIMQLLSNNLEQVSEGYVEGSTMGSADDARVRSKGVAAPYRLRR
jgi:nucleoside 2-deoxyribosyltransferase